MRSSIGALTSMRPQCAPAQAHECNKAPVCSRIGARGHEFNGATVRTRARATGSMKSQRAHT